MSLLKRVGLLVLLAVLASCSATSGNYDWCYTFDFVGVDLEDALGYDVYFSVGEQTASGLSSVGSDLVFFLTTGDVIMNPALITANLRVVVPTPPAAINADLAMFGVNQSFYSSVSETGIIYLEYPYDRPDSYSNRITIDASATNGAELHVLDIAIKGYGAVPYATSLVPNECGPTPTATNTPNVLPSPTLIPTNTPTPTPTPTSTGTMTSTPAATNTPGGGWCRYYDFTISDYGWTAFSFGGAPAGEWITGVGWRAKETFVSTRSYDYYMHAVIQISSASNYDLRYSELYYNIPAVDLPSSSTAGIHIASGGAQRNPVFWSAMYTGAYNGTGMASSDIDVNAATTIIATLQNGAKNTTLSALSPAVITAIRLEGFGANVPTTGADCYSSPTAVPTSTITETSTVTPTASITPTSTITPTPTNTPTYDQACYFANPSFNGSAANWTLSGTARYATGSVIMENGDTISQTVTLPAGAYYLSVKSGLNQYDANTNGTATIDYWLDHEDPPLSLWGFTSVTRNMYLENANQYLHTELIDGGVPAGSRTITIEAELPSTIPSIKILEVCISPVPSNEIENENEFEQSGNSTGWAVCTDIISTPTNWLDIGAWINWLWQNIVKFVTCVILPFFRSILDFLLWIGQLIWGFFEWIGDVFNYIFGWLNTWWQIGWWLVRALWASVEYRATELIDQIIANGIILYVTGATFLALIMQWINAANAILISLVSLYNAAPATPLPGLWDCVNSPMTNDICAIYYVMENTVLANFIGGLIIPLIIIYIDLLSLMYFSNQIKRFVRRAAEVLDA